jgi:hypothetical protein
MVIGNRFGFGIEGRCTICLTRNAAAPNRERYKSRTVSEGKHLCTANARNGR